MPSSIGIGRIAKIAFDELKNQWGWGGFVTRDFKRTRIMVRLNALVYNWWSLFVRMLDPECRREAKTSRPLMMQGVARATRHGRQTTLLLTVAHSASDGLRAAFAQTCRFLREVQNAPQLTAHERWCRILGYAMRKSLHGTGAKTAAGMAAGLIQASPDSKNEAPTEQNLLRTHLLTDEFRFKRSKELFGELTDDGGVAGHGLTQAERARCGSFT